MVNSNVGLFTVSEQFNENYIYYEIESKNKTE